jgi:hypothetical protein
MAAAGGSVEGGYEEGKGRETAVVGRVNAAVSSRRSGGGRGARGRPDAAGEAGGRAGKRGEGGGRSLKKPDVWAPHVSK